MDDDSQKESVVRRLYLNLKVLERRHFVKLRKNEWLSRFSHSSLFSFSALPVCRGLAIGMFWAFVPMPFQMAPATLFCLLFYANWPIALLAVWISNPLTYAPLLFLEYQIGYYLFAPPDAPEMTFGEFNRQYESGKEWLASVFFLVLKGSLALSMVMSAAGYAAGYPLSAWLRRYIERRRKKRADAS